MHKLFHSWIALHRGSYANNSSSFGARVLDFVSAMRSMLSGWGWGFLASLVALFLSPSLAALIPGYSAYAPHAQAVIIVAFCICSIFFLRDVHLFSLKMMEHGEYDCHAKDVAKLLIINGFDSLQDFDAVLTWSDELIRQRQAYLDRFKTAWTAILSFVLGITASLLPIISAPEAALQLVLSISLLVLGFAIIDVPASLFHLIDSVIPKSLKSLQHFKCDLLESRPHFMKLIQHRDKTELVRRFYEEIISRGDLDKINEYVSEKLVIRDGGDTYPAGVSGMRNHVESLRHTYPDLTIRVLKQYVSDDVVVSEVSMSGTFECSFVGISPDGKQTIIHAVNVDRVADGLIVEHSGAANTFETLLSRNLIRGTSNAERS